MLELAEITFAVRQARYIFRRSADMRGKRRALARRSVNIVGKTFIRALKAARAYAVLSP